MRNPAAVLVTGGAGFIGTHVTRALRDRGTRVVVADLRASPEPGVESVVGDLTEPGAVEAALDPGIDAVVHLAARTSVLESVGDPARTFDVNVSMTQALLERSREVRVNAFVFASTNAVSGATSDEGALLDEGSPLHPLTPYGATKAAGEMLLSAYGSSYEMRTVALRLTNVYGPGMGAKDSVIPRLLRVAMSGDVFSVYGDGAQVRDYVHVHDVLAAIELGLTGDLPSPLIIGAGESISVVDLVERVRRTTGAPVETRHVPPRAGEMRAVRVDNARALAAGWEPRLGIDDGLAQLWAWWRSQ